jgi:hypothetical protein
MKNAIIVLFFLVSSVTSFKPPSFESPSVVKITAAEAFCDEFRRIPCSDCRKVFSTVLPWWIPDRCAAVKSKTTSRRKTILLHKRGDRFRRFGAASGAVGGAMALFSALMGAYSASLALDQSKIANDPTSDPINIGGFIAPWQVLNASGYSTPATTP